MYILNRFKIKFLTGSKLSSSYPHAVISGDLYQPAFCSMYFRILFQPLKTKLVFSLLFDYIFQ